MNTHVWNQIKHVQQGQVIILVVVIQDMMGIIAKIVGSHFFFFFFLKTKDQANEINIYLFNN